MTDASSEVAWTPAAKRALHSLPEKVATAAIEFIYEAVAANPHRVGRELRLDLNGIWSARRGDYRVLYRIDEVHARVELIAIEHRRDVYRRRR